ncbi:MAG: penicillin-binding transpeptidase domain-containing protein [Desulfococcaceae bacterium]
MKKNNIAIVLIVCTLLSFMGFRLSVLQKQGIPGQIAAHVSAESVSEEKPETIPKMMEDESLFRSLWEEKLITALPDDRLELSPPDSILIQKAQHPDLADTEEMKKQEKLLKALYHSPPGRVIRTQINLWNETRFLTAIRDNRPGFAEQPVCQWQAYESEHPEWQFIRTGNLVPEDYGYVNAGKLVPGYTDWLTAFSLSEPVEFRTTVEVKSNAPVTVQIIGKPVLPLSPAFEKILPCPKKNCTADQADAFQISLKPGRHSLVIKVAPVKNNETEVSGLLIRKTKQNEQSVFKWFRPEPPEVSLASAPVRIFTSDKILLADEKGNPTEKCMELGLLSLVGTGEKSRFALWNLLHHAHGRDTDIFLTIDSRIQQAAQKALKKKIDEFHTYADDRKAAVIVLNAETGAILAAAGYPLPPLGVHPWDLASFAKVYSIKNPMQVRAWQGVDGDYMPGSTFKPVTALAAMTAAEHDESISGFLKGYSQNGFEKNTGLSLNCEAYAPFEEKCGEPNNRLTIDNFKVLIGKKLIYETPQHIFEGDSLLGLKEAIRESLNVWFIRLALLTDGKDAAAYDNPLAGQQKPDIPNFHLVQTARELGFGDMPMDLAFAPENVKFALRRNPEKESEGDVLFGNAGKPDLMNPKGPLTWILAQNSIGQGVTATPLQMARVAASICNGHLINPFLIQWDKKKKSHSPKLKGGSLSLLYEGMNAVPKSGGTAGDAFAKFPEIRDRVFGKTGTANIGKQREYFTAWFTGWHKKAEEKPEIPDLAFACMISHAHGTKSDTGGSVAAPVIADMLDRIYREKTKND